MSEPKCQCSPPRYASLANVVETPRICLAWSLRERTERGVYAASASHSSVTLRNFPSARNVQTVKRPEGRAPVPLLVRALNTYRHHTSRRTASAGRFPTGT